MLVDEYEAAAKFGWDAYWSSSYEQRVLMVAQMRGRSLITDMQNHDAAEWAREKAEREAKG